jgi:hypothetical protein
MSSPKPLTREDRLEVFRIATRSFVHWYGEQFDRGMSDDELKEKLVRALGEWGGSGGPDRVDELHMASGLRIWGSWEPINRFQLKPLFSGTATIAMAREVYGITNPDDSQMVLF